MLLRYIHVKTDKNNKQMNEFEKVWRTMLDNSFMKTTQVAGAGCEREKLSKHALLCMFCFRMQGWMKMKLGHKG